MSSSHHIFLDYLHLMDLTYIIFSEVKLNTVTQMVNLSCFCMIGTGVSPSAESQTYQVLVRAKFVFITAVNDCKY